MSKFPRGFLLLALAASSVLARPDGNEPGEEPDPTPITQVYACQGAAREALRLAVTWIPRPDFGDDFRIQVTRADGRVEDSGLIRADGRLHEPSSASSALLAAPYMAFHTEGRSSVLSFRRDAQGALQLRAEYALVLGEGTMSVTSSAQRDTDGFLKTVSGAECLEQSP